MSWPTGFAQLFCASILHCRVEANLLQGRKWRQLFSNSHQAFVGEEAKCSTKVPWDRLMSLEELSSTFLYKDRMNYLFNMTLFFPNNCGRRIHSLPWRIMNVLCWCWLSAPLLLCVQLNEPQWLSASLCRLGTMKESCGGCYALAWWAPRRYWKNNDEDVAAPFWAQEIIPVSNWVTQLQCSIHWFWGYPTDESFCIQSSIVSQHTGLQSLKRSQVRGGSGVAYPKSCPRKLHLNQDLKLDAIDFLSFPDEMYESQ